jgi:protocatechuate 3,4-dioxygenase beta subunit
MISDRSHGGDSQGRKPSNSVVTPTRNSNRAIAALLLCVGVVMVWLFWPVSGEETVEPTAAVVAGQSEGDNARAPADLFGNPKEESQNSVTDPFSIANGEVTDNTVVAPAQEDSGEALAATFAIAGSDREIDDDPVRLPISGWVLDQAGEPVADIGVTASARRLAQDGQTSGHGGETDDALTDTEGYFAFGELPDGEYLLQTESTDLYGSATSIVRTGVSSVVLRVTGESGKPVTIYGAVTEEDGQPIAGARVAPTDESHTATTDGAGKYSLELTVDRRSRTRSLRFTKAGYRAEILGVRQSDLRELSEWRLDARLQVKDGVSVDGTVTGVEGTPVTGARIQLYSQSHGRSHQATSGQDGSFFMDNVEMGDDYRLWVRPKADFQDYVDEGFQVGRGGLFVPVVLEPLEDSSLRGRMVNAFRDPIPRYTLWMWNSGAGANRNLAVTSDSGGHFLVDDIPAGEVVLGSRGHPQFTVGGIQLEPRKTTTANLVLDWGYEEMAGQLLNSDSGEPVAGAEVTLFWTSEEQGVTSRSRRLTVADSSGYFVFTELGPGPHTIIVTARGFHSVRRDAVPGEGIVIELQKAAS